jgi:hypothetical protein
LANGVSHWLGEYGRNLAIGGETPCNPTAKAGHVDGKVTLTIALVHISFLQRSLLLFWKQKFFGLPFTR